MGKETSKECLGFFQDDKGRLFFIKLSFKEFKKKFSSWPIRALGLFWNATKQQSFRRIFRYILYSIVKKMMYLWIFYLRCFIHFEIGLSALIYLCWIIFVMCSADLTCANGSTSQICVMQIALRINLWAFE